MLKLIFIDTETTGLDNKRHAIVQLSGEVVYYNENKYEEIEKFNFGIKPFKGAEIDKEALLVNNLTQEAINEYEDSSEVIVKFKNILAKHCDRFNKTDKMFFVGYNARFDYDFTRSWFEREGDNYLGSYFYSPPIDVMNMAAVKLMDKRGVLPNFKLETVAQFLRIDIVVDSLEGFHNSAVDIGITKRLFYKLMEMGNEY